MAAEPKLLSGATADDLARARTRVPAIERIIAIWRNGPAEAIRLNAYGPCMALSVLPCCWPFVIPQLPCLLAGGKVVTTLWEKTVYTLTDQNLFVQVL